MARFARVVLPEVPYHVTQRGNGRQAVFASDEDRIVYMELLRKYSDFYGLELLGYCLMTNHIHLIVIPRKRDSLSQNLKHVHGRYAGYWNAKRSSSGHLWQGRFYSCPLGEGHLWEALRYVELNPVRAGLVGSAECWRWSSAAPHCGVASADVALELQRWRQRWAVEEWRHFLAEGESETSVNALRRCTHSGRPLGSEEFVAAMERRLLRPLAPRKGGRPKKHAADRKQVSVGFVA